MLPERPRHKDYAAAILSPSRLWSRDEIFGRPCPVPDESGVYGWYFGDVPDGVELTGCVTHGSLPLLYVGISPKRPPANGRPQSEQTLRTRIKYHMRGNAEGSTLRLTLGCLLASRLGLELRRVGSGSRMTFSSGEGILNSWLSDNAFVCWSPCPEPWLVEEEIIRTVSLPLNLDQNQHHPFHRQLSAIRSRAKQRARSLPVLPTD